MVEVATIARPYANALYQLCKEKIQGNSNIDSSDALESVISWMQTTNLFVAHQDMLNIALNPNLSHNDLFEVIISFLEKFYEPKKTSFLLAECRNFLYLLIKNKRLIIFPEVLRQFRYLYNIDSGVHEVLVYSAFKLHSEEVKLLQASLEKRFRKNLSLRMLINSSLIGGFVAVCGDQVLDASVRYRLELMRTSLFANAFFHKAQ